MTKTKELVEDAVLYIPRSTIHPDPDQPRVKVDDELQASIDSEGIIQAITVRPHPAMADEWMIVDGERRYLGGAHLKTIPCRIRLDLEDSVDRLVTQLSANTGKPLSPIEQARAFKKALDSDPKLTQAKLAERLGIPRTTIGDRIRLIEIHSAWMKLIESGRLQVSHAPIIHQYRAVPEEYQVKAAKYVADNEGYQLPKFDKVDSIPIADFRKILRGAFRDYVIEFDKVRSYKGPVLDIEEEGWKPSGGYALRKVKYAADIKLWRPIRREAEKRAKKARESTPRSGGHWEPAVTKAVKALKAAGFEVPLRPVGKTRVLPNADETIIFNEQGWAKDLHPKVLLEKMDPSTITYVKGNFGGDELYTSDVAAVAAAREAYRDRVAEVAGKELAPLRAKLTAKVLAEYAVTGAGAVHLLGVVGTDRGDAKVLSLALGLSIGAATSDDGFEDDEPDLSSECKPSDAQQLLSALAATVALDIKIPDSWQIAQKIRNAIGEVAFKLKPASPSKSKKQQKREARAAGKPVGDPSRAKNSVTAGEAQMAEEDLEDDLATDEELELVEA
jgi:ParB/RepB/Spo0J family partition protein